MNSETPDWTDETASVLDDPAAMADIREADEAYERGDGVRGVAAVRRLLAVRR